MKTQMTSKPSTIKRSTALCDRAKRRVHAGASVLFFGVLFSILIPAAFFTASSASSPNKVLNDSLQSAGAVKSVEKETTLRSENLFLKTSRAPALLPQAGTESVATYEVVAGACTNNLKDSFALGDS